MKRKEKERRRRKGKVGTGGGRGEEKERVTGTGCYGWRGVGRKVWLRNHRHEYAEGRGSLEGVGETLEMGWILSGKDGMGVVQEGQETGGKSL